MGSIDRVCVAVRDMPSSPVTSCVASSVGGRVSDVPVSVSVGVPSVSVIEPLAVCPTSVGEPMRVVDGVGCTRERGDADFVVLFVKLCVGVFEDRVLEREEVPPVRLFVRGLESDLRLTLRTGVSVRLTLVRGQESVRVFGIEGLASVRLGVGVLELLVPVPEGVRVCFFSTSPVALPVGTSDRIALSVSVNDGVTLLYVSDGATDIGLSLNVRDLLLVSFLSFSSVKVLPVNDGVTLPTEGPTEGVSVRDALLYISDGDALS